MTNYDKTLAELVERAMEERALSLQDYIVSEELQTYRIEELTILEADRVNNVIVPCLEYMILAHERYMPEDKHPVAQYAIYRQEDDDECPIMNSLNYAATYVLESVSEETFENMAMAICSATSAIYMRERGNGK